MFGKRLSTLLYAPICDHERLMNLAFMTFLQKLQGTHQRKKVSFGQKLEELEIYPDWSAPLVTKVT